MTNDANWGNINFSTRPTSTKASYRTAFMGASARDGGFYNTAKSTNTKTAGLRKSLQTPDAKEQLRDSTKALEEILDQPIKNRGIAKSLVK